MKYNTGIFYRDAEIYKFCVENNIEIFDVYGNYGIDTALYAYMNSEEATAFYLKFGEKPRLVRDDNL